MHSGIFRTLVDVLGFYEDVDSLGGERARNPNVSREELDPLVRFSGAARLVSTPSQPER